MKTEMALEDMPDRIGLVTRWGYVTIAWELVVIGIKLVGVEALSRLTHHLGPLAPMMCGLVFLSVAATIQLATGVPTGYRPVALGFLKYATDASQLVGVLASFIAFSQIAMNMDPGMSTKVLLARVFEQAAHAFVASATGLGLALACHSIKTAFDERGAV